MQCSLRCCVTLGPSTCRLRIRVGRVSSSASSSSRLFPRWFLSLPLLWLYSLWLLLVLSLALLQSVSSSSSHCLPPDGVLQSRAPSPRERPLDFGVSELPHPLPARESGPAGSSQSPAPHFFSPFTPVHSALALMSREIPSLSVWFWHESPHDPAPDPFAPP